MIVLQLNVYPKIISRYSVCCQSVGLIAEYHKEIENIEDTTYYNVFVSNISGDLGDIPFQRLEVGSAGLSENSENPEIYGKTTFKIIPKGVGKYFGFTISGNHRFLLGTFDVVRNTGKTTLITSLLYAKKHIFPVGMIMSGTEDSNGHYRKMFPSTFVYNKLNEDQVENFVKRQKIAKKHLPNPWAVLFLDDCTDDPKLFNKPLFQGLYKNGRIGKCGIFFLSNIVWMLNQLFVLILTERLFYVNLV